MRTLHSWPAASSLRDLVLTPTAEERPCGACGGHRTICDHRFHTVETFGGPVRLVCKLIKCVDAACPRVGKTFSPEAELAIVPPRLVVDWEIFAWIGHRRFARHWSVPQLRAELADSHRIHLSDDAIESYVTRYETMLAARQSDPVHFAADYRDIPELVLSIDGLQPEKGHETLYVVRELNARRVWFAEPLLSSTDEAIEALLVRARELAATLGKPVRAWVTDKQSAFVTGIAKVFPEVPHRLCKIHFLRALAKDVLAADQHIKVTMRKKVRGLRAIEQEAMATSSPVVATPSSQAVPSEGPTTPAVPSEGAVTLPAAHDAITPASSLPTVPPGAAVVLDYCTAVRGILVGDQGDPLHPTGTRMASALEEVQASIDRCLAGKKGGRKRHG